MERIEPELVYPGKKSEKEILSGQRAANLEKVKYFGKFYALENNWNNMLIFGDNLSVLKALLADPDINGKVKLIYIDPPFATNHDFKVGRLRTATISASEEDETAYEDRLLESEYFEFLRERLILMRELLAHNGSIYVHIDTKVGHYVKIIMDEVFGKEHFINDITRIKCNPKNFPRKAYGNIKDMILFYSKTDNYVWNDPREPYTWEDVERLFPKIDKNGQRYTTVPLHAPGETKDGATGQPWRGISPPKGRHWRYPPDVLEELDKKGLIEWSGRGVPRLKIYADEFIKRGKRMQDIWEFKDPQYPSYPTEKNLEMLKVIIEASSNPGDIVLDAFAGSGTTLVAAETLGRRWIGIDNSPYAIEISIKRLQKLENLKLFTLYNATGRSLPETLQEFLQ
ncbi:Type III restriction-modification system methylation subunit [Conexivisphaera calida]|uniref:Type III restriction-modification system methylation subunit n=2 Tax=Conexivisphaera calida TaxID=1874277 RepID=A0A4P2VNA7_9ARCH|nr:site-specific DNA-methyltransferase [Conexivisphaera calida]BBE42438.1 Type III restriction-modification system methylation subunit [Conexivisphaera calida]